MKSNRKIEIKFNEINKTIDLTQIAKAFANLIKKGGEELDR